MTLVESVMAMAVTALLATTTLGLVVSTARVTGDAARRTVAAGLLTSTLETLRGLSPVQVPDGALTSRRTVDGVEYTIAQTSAFLTDAGSSVCTSTGVTLTYKRIDVSVSWPGMTDGTQPVRGSTLKSVGIGAGSLDQTALGSLAVLVQGADSSPQAGVSLSLTASGSPTPVLASTTTGDDGCAVFTGLTPGGYVATLTAPGFAGITNAATVSTAVQTVQAGTITRTAASYAPARSLLVRLSDEASAVPAGLPLRVGDSYLPETTVPACDGTPTTACTTGLPGTVQGLFPALYTVKVGACPETSPSQVAVDLGPTANLPTGFTPTATVPVGTVTVTIAQHNGTPVVGRVVTAAHGPGCSESYQLPASTATGFSAVLPYGTWVLSAPLTSTSGSVTSTTVTLAPATPAAAVSLTVSS